uniref:Uncharacterized protein n=1 Tax=Magallana gigas TaxID=29159 RepID=K1R4Y9_MAGGI
MYQSNQKSYSTRKEKCWLFISRLEVDKKGRHIKRNGSRPHMRGFFFDLGGLWDTTIDDITLSQASEQIEKEIECENLLENIALSQAIDLFNPGPADMESNYFVDFDLLAKKEGGSSLMIMT